MLIQVTTVKSKVCFGYTNKAQGNLYLPFFDYDNVNYELVKHELLFLQEKFKLSDIYIYTSINGFNALSLDKLPFNTLVKLYNECEYVCSDYMQLGLNRSFLTLRIGRDKKLHEVLKSSSTYYKRSFAHGILLSVFFDTTIENTNNFDNSLHIRLKAYRSEKHGFLKVKEL
jgi:hypothetical protein